MDAFGIDEGGEDIVGRGTGAVMDAGVESTGRLGGRAGSCTVEKVFA